MGRYQDLIENNISPELNQFIEKAQEGNFDFKSLNILNMLNTKYILAGSAENAVFQNPYAYGPAWIPSEVIAVSSNNEEIDMLNTIDTRQSATYYSPESVEIPPGMGEITLESYLPNKLVYEVQAVQGGLAVFSEIYYPEGWKASINGSDAEILRVNYALRGLVVPEGKSTVEFTFFPENYYLAAKAMVGSQYLILLLLFVGLFYPLYPNKKH